MPLDVICFKPFKTIFRKQRYTPMINANYIELKKIVLARWVDKTQDQAFKKKYHLRVQKYRDLVTRP
jgi:hypothetical protein